MQSMTNDQAFQFWVVGLCMAVTVVILTVTALWFIWKRRPVDEENLQELDQAQQYKIHERLAQLAQEPRDEHVDQMMRAS